MILVLGGTTGGLGKELHQALCALLGDSQTVIPIGRKDCDMDSEQSIAEFLSKIRQGFDTPLHVINATGVSVSAMIHKADYLDIVRMLKVNLVANILLLKHARELYKAHGGTFTMISSITGRDGPAGTSAYAASKAGLSGLVRVAAKEFARVNTRVNIIECGYFDRGMISQVPEDQLRQILTAIPLQRLGNASDLAEACKFLIQCEYVTGATIKLNGGLA